MQISVIIPVYNAEKYVAKAVESALQFPEVKEVLLIEDGSPDNALLVCLQLAAEHDRVKLFQHPDKGNHGAGASRNLGLENASCPFIAFLDADDFYLPNRFDADKRVFDENPDADGVYNAIGIHFYNAKAKSNYNKTNMKHLTTVNKKINPDDLFQYVVSMRETVGYYTLDGLTIKLKMLHKMDYWFNDELRLHQDSEFLKRLPYYGRLFPGQLASPVAGRGVHEENRIISLQFQKERKRITQSMLWNSLYNWATCNNLASKYTDHLRRMSIRNELMTLPYFKAWTYFIRNLYNDKCLFWISNYYNTIHYYFFGKNLFAKFLLVIKYFIHQLFRIPNKIKL
jgi:glycosyltransferase involved in cell wall biosynthesis